MDTSNVNVHPVERRASTALGGILLLQSFFRRSPALGEKAIAAALLYRGISGHSFLYQAFGISTASTSQQQQSSTSNEMPEIKRSITIEKPADEVYRFWRDPQHLSQILGDSAEVTDAGNGRTHWMVQGPLNRRLEWDTEIVEDRPGEVLRWKSVDGTQLPNEGSIRFHSAPRDWGTEATFYFRFDAPGGTLGNTVAKGLSFVPRMMADKALRRFKSLIETGEYPTLKHNSAARAGSYAEAASSAHS